LSEECQIPKPNDQIPNPNSFNQQEAGLGFGFWDVRAYDNSGMDVASVIAAVASSLGLSLPAAAWLSQSLIKNRLDKDLTTFKADIEAAHKARQAGLDGEIRQRVETVLGERAAERQYAFEAKKRLYTAIGPLRFQLLLACRDLSGRVISRGTAGREGYSTDITGYYGRSTLFRILRPLCLGELIERQIAYADFSVDPDAVDLLRFKKSASKAFSGDALVLHHPRVNWNDQVEHVYVDNVARCASALITAGTAGERAMRFNEFETCLGEAANVARLDPFPCLLAKFSPSSMPLLWLRLVAYGALCNDMINTAGVAVGFERQDYPTRDLLVASQDAIICANVDDYVKRCESLLTQKL